MSDYFCTGGQEGDFVLAQEGQFCPGFVRGIIYGGIQYLGDYVCSQSHV